MTCVNIETDHRVFSLNVRMIRKDTQLIFLILKAKKALKQKVVHFISGISLSLNPQPFIVDTKTVNTERIKPEEKK